MAKKIFDILPPKELKKKEVVLPEKKTKPIKKVSFPSLPPLRKKPLFFSLILILIITASYFFLPKAEIEAWLDSEPLILETKVTVDGEISTLDFSAQIIPGNIFEAEKTISDEFLASGTVKREKKAEGVIRIYNDCSQGQILVATTRFQAPWEKFNPPLEKGENPWFRITQRVTIPAKSSIEVPVIADSPGAQYNIEASTFSVPGLVGSPMYTCIYGKSFQPMAGGFHKEVSQVTEKDLSEAEKVMIERVEEITKTALKSKISSEFVLLEEAIKVEILDSTSSAEAGEEKEKFLFEVKSFSETLSFKNQDLNDLAKELLSLRILPGKELYEESLSVNYLVESVDLKGGKINLSLTIEAKIYSSIEETGLKQALRGKSLSEAKMFLENCPSITKVNVRLWPFWVKKIPQAAEKITVKLRID